MYWIILFSCQRSFIVRCSWPPPPPHSLTPRAVFARVYGIFPSFYFVYFFLHCLLRRVPIFLVFSSFVLCGVTLPTSCCLRSLLLWWIIPTLFICSLIYLFSDVISCFLYCHSSSQQLVISGLSILYHPSGVFFMRFSRIYCVVLALWRLSFIYYLLSLDK